MRSELNIEHCTMKIYVKCWIKDLDGKNFVGREENQGEEENKGRCLGRRLVR